jgi:hypothetical protein
VRSGRLRCSGRSGLLRSGPVGVLRSVELLRQRLRQRLRRWLLRLVPEVVPSRPRLRPQRLLRSRSELLRSGADLCGSDLRCSVRCLQLMS